MRSPRRVPINSQGAGPAPFFSAVPSSSLAPTALVAPADKLTSAAPATLFDAPVRSAAPPIVRSAAPRAVRARRTRATEAELLAAAAPIGLPAPTAAEPAPAHAAPTRTTRRAAAAAVAPPRSAPAPVAPIVRSARRPARREPSAEEVVAAPAPTVEDDPKAAPTSSSSDDAASSRPHSRAAPQFHPAPAVTQDELNRLTQRNTKRNEQHLNKLKLVTVYMDTDRPPSPTSKLRRSFGSEAPEVVRASTKAGREARAAKRRNALRASADGTELAQLTADLLAEGEDAAEGVRAAAVEAEEEEERPRAHFRAAGDDEQYSTPTRALPIKSKAGAKKRSSAAEGEGEGDARRENKAVRWDRALVYEGPKEGDAPVPDASILKVRPLLLYLAPFLELVRLSDPTDLLSASRAPAARRTRRLGQLDDGDDQPRQGCARHDPHARLQGRAVGGRMLSLLSSFASRRFAVLSPGHSAALHTSYCSTGSTERRKHGREGLEREKASSASSR